MEFCTTFWMACAPLDVVVGEDLCSLFRARKYAKRTQQDILHSPYSPYVPCWHAMVKRAGRRKRGGVKRSRRAAEAAMLIAFADGHRWSSQGSSTLITFPDSCFLANWPLAQQMKMWMKMRMRMSVLVFAKTVRNFGWENGSISISKVSKCYVSK